AEPRTQDRNHERCGTPELGPDGLCEWSLHGDLCHPNVPGRLVGKQGHQLIGEPSEGRGVGPYITQSGQLVRDQGVVDDQGFQSILRVSWGNGTVPGSWTSPSLTVRSHLVCGRTRAAQVVRGGFVRPWGGVLTRRECLQGEAGKLFS